MSDEMLTLSCCGDVSLGATNIMVFGLTDPAP
jgi:hypothetical protein